MNTSGINSVFFFLFFFVKKLQGLKSDVRILVNVSEFSLLRYQFTRNFPKFCRQAAFVTLKVEKLP